MISAAERPHSQSQLFFQRRRRAYLDPFLAMMFFAGAGMALLICSSAIDYSRKLPV